MNNEIPPSMTTAPIAMNSALLLLRVLPPDVLVDAFWMTVGVALVVDGVGDTGSPGASGLLAVVGSGTAGVVAANAADEPSGTISVAASAAAASRPRRGATAKSAPRDTP
jgi:hypothetical protein